MKSFRKTILQMPLRRVTQLVIGCVAVVALLAAAVVVQRLLMLKAIQAERAHKESQRHIHHTMLVTEAQLQQATEKITVVSMTAIAASGKEQASVDNVRRLDAMGAQYGVTLVSMAPGAPRDVMTLEETPVDLEMKGRYHDLATMLLAMPAALPNTAVTHLSATREDGSVEVTMKLRIAGYRYKERRGR